MGMDKSLLLLDGLPLACRVASALLAGGATSVTAIGGDRASLKALGLALVDALAVDDGAMAAVSTADGHPEPLHTAWRVSALPAIEAAFAAGQRSPRRLLATMPHILVELGGGAWSVDMDTPTG